MKIISHSIIPFASILMAQTKNIEVTLSKSYEAWGLDFWLFELPFGLFKF